MIKLKMMSKEGFKIPPSIKKWFDTKMLLILGIAGKMIWDTFQVGAEVKYQQHFQETMKTEGVKNIVKTQITDEIDFAMDDANLWKKAFGNDHLIDFVSDKVSEAKQHIVNEVVAADSSKINIVSGLGVMSGIRDEDVMPLLSELLIALDNGELMLKADAEKYIDREVKKQTTRTVRADF